MDGGVETAVSCYLPGLGAVEVVCPTHWVATVVELLVWFPDW